ncbi:unnamed protein product [Durusdinium trenchii]|uniref:Uncharacterized protein n=1 Tax=Durusdinium trenchii TaxID=1381693 RepID=A0ABP0QY33_9DINO
MQLDQLHVPPASRTVDGDPQQCREAATPRRASQASTATAIATWVTTAAAAMVTLAIVASTVAIAVAIATEGTVVMVVMAMHIDRRLPAGLGEAIPSEPRRLLVVSWNFFTRHMLHDLGFDMSTG